MTFIDTKNVNPNYIEKQSSVITFALHSGPRYVSFPREVLICLRHLLRTSWSSNFGRPTLVQDNNVRFFFFFVVTAVFVVRFDKNPLEKSFA